MNPFLILQLRPEAEAADEEYASFLRAGGLARDQTVRIRLDREEIPPGLSLATFSGIIVGGGPGCISDLPARKTPMEARIETAILALMSEITGRDLPFLGCCYGIGILAHHLGARVSKDRYGEGVGAVECSLTESGRQDPVLSGLPGRFLAFVGHKEAVQELPRDCVQLVESQPCPFQMIRAGRNVYATQFHPEANSESFALRIRIYREKGYFPQEDAARLTAMCQAARVDVPSRIVGNFVRTYGRASSDAN
jgi:GMP synthase (glutamine-hydrolysing)